MKKIGKKSICLIISLLMILSVISGATVVFATDGDNQAGDENNVLQKNMKTASALDANLETKINLTFPGKSEIEPTDIVFVVDKSGMSAEIDINKQTKQFLEEIKAHAEDKGLNIKVGVVLFNKIGNIKQELTDITTGYDDTLKALNQSVNSGTNIQAGLLAAKEMLDNDTDVEASNKHVILVSDGATYLYCKNGDYKKAYTRSLGNLKGKINPVINKPFVYAGNHKGGIWESLTRDYNMGSCRIFFSDGKTPLTLYSTLLNAKLFDEYLDYYKKAEADPKYNWSQYDYEYTLSAALFGPKKVVPFDDPRIPTPVNNDIAIWSADEVFQDMVNAGYDMNVYYKNKADFPGNEILKYMARNSNNWELNKDFEDVKKKIIYKISKGSYIEDIVGKDFEFVNDIKKLKLNVGDEALNAEKIEADKYGFGKNDIGEYRYVLEHKTELQAGVTVEKLILNINETVFPTKAVTLEYYEKLVNVPKKTGTYKYNTNESAILYPVAANGKKGNPMVFPVPELTYKYKSVEDKPTAKPDNNKTVTHVKNSAPRTGDSKDMAYSIILLGFAGALLAVLEIKKRKEN